MQNEEGEDEAKGEGEGEGEEERSFLTTCVNAAWWLGTGR
jgi:hypothetical protein